MGSYFLVVNPAKRQYLDPGRLGEAIKFSAVLRGDFCLHALKQLIADCFPQDARSFRGAWLGDPIILASDDSGLPNPGGVATATTTDSARNLNALAQAEFNNISYRAIAELSRNIELATEMAARAKNDRSFLIDLGATLAQYDLEPLEHALEQVVGRPWRKAYNKALVELQHWQPLPPIDWPL